MNFANQEHGEIIIVRRGGDDDHDGHHGGVWKIAFADFMTAMMCFFLVMWLINAANEETRVSVASYFNPVKLVDKTSAKRGLDEAGEGPLDADSETQTSDTEKKKPDDVGPSTTGPATSPNAPKSTEAKTFSDQSLFKDPYGVLAEIAGEAGVEENVSAKGEGGAADAGPATGASGGEAYRDPFAPDFWSEEVIEPTPAEQVEQAKAEAVAEESKATEIAAAPTPAADAQAHPEAVAPMQPAPPPVSQDMAAAFPAPAETPVFAEPSRPSDDPPPLSTGPTPLSKPTGAPAVAQPSPETAGRPASVAARIGEELRQAFGPDEKMFGGISVVPVDKGVMISVTDQLNVGMFEIGSAVPRRELVLAMEKISKVLGAEKGSIVINGHTDARPYAGKAYDNWRLSSARAQSAYYMLARAGLDERRVIEVAGFADRKLKLKDDPYAEANRRIEILLETGG
jgi:chemotaxis protein MotB